MSYLRWSMRVAIPQTTTLLEVMTREPETLWPTDTVRDALDKMNAGHFRHLPVITENRAPWRDR